MLKLLLSWGDGSLNHQRRVIQTLMSCLFCLQFNLVWGASAIQGDFTILYCEDVEVLQSTVCFRISITTMLST